MWQRSAYGPMTRPLGESLLDGLAEPGRSYVVSIPPRNWPPAAGSRCSLMAQVGPPGCQPAFLRGRSFWLTRPGARGPAWREPTRSFANPPKPPWQWMPTSLKAEWRRRILTSARRVCLAAQGFAMSVTAQARPKSTLANIDFGGALANDKYPWSPVPAHTGVMIRTA